MSIRGRIIRWAFLLTLCRLSVVSADEASKKFSDEDVRFFETKIRPVLVERCYGCHSAASAKANKLKGGLRVDSRSALLLGGESGPAVVPGDGAKSLLLEALRYDSLQMPPDGKLSDSVLADFTRWIERGAADPRIEDEPVARPQIDIAAGRRHWAYRPLSKIIHPDGWPGLDDHWEEAPLIPRENWSFARCGSSAGHPPLTAIYG